MDKITKAIRESREERTEPLFKTDKKYTEKDLYREKLFSLFWGFGMGIFIGVMIGLIL